MALIRAGQDVDLVDRIRAGDEQAANEFVSRFRPRLELILRLKSKVPPSDSPDIVQETLIAALTQIRTGAFRNESSLGTWLTAILTKKIASYFRKPSTRREIPLEASNGVGAAWLVPISGNAVEEAMIVEQALAQLSPNLRLVLVLNQSFGLTTGEIANRLGKPPGTIGRHLADAKKRLRKIMSGEEGSPLSRLLEGEKA